MKSTLAIVIYGYFKVVESLIIIYIEILVELEINDWRKKMRKILYYSTYLRPQLLYQKILLVLC